MAVQSAWLLAGRLVRWHRECGGQAMLDVVAEQYKYAWHRLFAPRLYVSSLLAQWAMRPVAVAGAMPFIRRLPQLLYWGALLSGKATRVV